MRMVLVRGWGPRQKPRSPIASTRPPYQHQIQVPFKFFFYMGPTTNGGGQVLSLHTYGKLPSGTAAKDLAVLRVYVVICVIFFFAVNVCNKKIVQSCNFFLR